MTVRFFALVMTLVTSTFLAGAFNSQAYAVVIGPSAFTSSATSIDFDSLAVGTAVDTQFSGLGVVFSSPSGAGGVVTFLAPGQVLSVASSITATFSVNVHQVGLDYSSNSPLYIELYDASNALIESFVNSSGTGFLGLQVNQFVAKAVIHDSGFGFAIDNFRYENPNHTVPEPGTLALLGSGLVVLGLWGRRRVFRR